MITPNSINHYNGELLQRTFYKVYQDPTSIENLDDGTIISFGNTRQHRVKKIDGINYAFDVQYKTICLEPLSLITLYKHIWIRK